MQNCRRKIDCWTFSKQPVIAENQYLYKKSAIYCIGIYVLKLLKESNATNTLNDWFYQFEYSIK